jgi:hypothetical protein
MANKGAATTKYDWPDTEEFVKIYVEGGYTYAAISDVVGAPIGTVASHISSDPGLRKGIKEAKAAQKIKRASVGEPVNELELVRHERDEALRAVSKARGEEVATERVIQSLERGISAAKPTYKPKKQTVHHNIDAHTLVLLFSDAHAGEQVNREAVNGLNEYNWQIMLERMQRLAESVRSHRDHYGVKARKLHIVSLGDGLNGEIHEDAKVSNEYPMAECAVRFGEDVAEWIVTELEPEFESIELDGVVGNHPRFAQKPRAKVAYDNGDWIATETTRIALKHHNIPVRAHKAKQAVIEICGRKYLLAHGDGVRTTMAGVPWGGVIRNADRLKALFNLSEVEVEAIFGGHWHNAQIAESLSVLINGSIKGIDEYSISAFGGGKPAKQLLAAMHPKWGITGVHPIDLQ